MTSSPSGSLFERVLVGVDDSDNSKRAVLWAVSLCLASGAELVIVHALGLTDTGRAGTADEHRRQPTLQVIDDVRANLETTWSEPAREYGIRYRTELEHGPALMALPRVAERLAVDLVVVGHQGAGQTSARLGSTSHGLLDLSPVTVACVPPE